MNEEKSRSGRLIIGFPGEKIQLKKGDLRMMNEIFEALLHWPYEKIIVDATRKDAVLALLSEDEKKRVVVCTCDELCEVLNR